MATVQLIAEALHALLMEGCLSQVTPPAGAELYMYQPCHGVCNTMQQPQPYLGIIYTVLYRILNPGTNEEWAPAK